MTSSQSKYDIEYVYGEFGENYTIQILNDDGTSADISWANRAKMTVLDMDGNVLFSVTTESASPLVIATPNVRWPMLASQTEASSYDGKIEVQVKLTAYSGSETRKKLTKVFDGFIYKNKVPS
jgi:hypothetical protein